MERIGRYEILSELGRGAMGIVYKARDTKIDREVAIKTIRLIDQAAPSETKALRQRLFREAQSAGRLSHPGIVTIYDVAEEAGLAYITMEFVEGRTLEDLMESGKAGDAAFVADFLLQTAAALDYAHGREIVHRDVKPANMIVTSEGTVKITDFGIARLASSQLTQTGTVMGTPSYMSPEQVRGETVDGRSDQFSLTVIAYELLTATKPFVADSLTATIFKIVSTEPPSLRDLRPDVSEELERAVLKGLAKQPDGRYDSCKALAEAVADGCRHLESAPPRAAAALQQTRQADDSSLELEATAPAMTAVSGPPAQADASSETLPPTERTAEKLPPLPPRAAVRARLEEEEELKESRRRTMWLRAGTIAAVLLLALVAATALLFPWALENPLGLTQRLLFPGAAQETDQQFEQAARMSIAGLRTDVVQPPELQPPAPAPKESAAQPTAQEPAASSAPAPQPAEPAQAESAPPPAPPRPPPAPPRKVAVAFISAVPGAEVVADGNPEWSCKTPCSLELPQGRHEFFASQTGFRRLRRNFEVNRNPFEIRFELGAVVGTVLVSSQPTGADIYVDGEKFDKPTNTAVKLPPGSHVIRVEKAGAGSAEQAVNVIENGLHRVRVNLQASQP